MSTSELINNIKDGDNVTANKTFDSLLKSKLNDALDVIEVNDVAINSNIAAVTIQFFF